MTCVTRDIRVAAHKRESGFQLVLKLDHVPTLWRVAAGAVLAQSTLVDIIFAMAGKTICWGIPEERVGLMTVITFCFAMLIEQFEIAKVVIKGLFVQANDARITPGVLGMTGGTICAARLRVQTMKTCCTGLVGTDLLVTIDTQAILTVARKGNMTGGTLRLEFGVAVDHLTRHDQGLDIQSYGAMHAQGPACQQQQPRP